MRKYLIFLCVQFSYLFTYAQDTTDVTKSSEVCFFIESGALYDRFYFETYSRLAVVSGTIGIIAPITPSVNVKSGVGYQNIKSAHGKWVITDHYLQIPVMLNFPSEELFKVGKIGVMPVVSAGAYTSLLLDQGMAIPGSGQYESLAVAYHGKLGLLGSGYLYMHRDNKPVSFYAGLRGEVEVPELTYYLSSGSKDAVNHQLIVLLLSVGIAF